MTPLHDSSPIPVGAPWLSLSLHAVHRGWHGGRWSSNAPPPCALNGTSPYRPSPAPSNVTCRHAASPAPSGPHTPTTLPVTIPPHPNTQRAPPTNGPLAALPFTAPALPHLLAQGDDRLGVLLQVARLGHRRAYPLLLQQLRRHRPDDRHRHDDRVPSKTSSQHQGQRQRVRGWVLVHAESVVPTVVPASCTHCKATRDCGYGRGGTPLT